MKSSIRAIVLLSASLGCAGGPAVATSPDGVKSSETAPLSTRSDDARVAPSASAAKPSASQAFVDAHNRVRGAHCAEPLTWSPALAESATRWAETLRDKGCSFGHSGTSAGENLAAGTTGSLDADGVVDLWYREGAQYSYAGGAFSAQTGHFTQVVWRGTRSVGCGRAQCKGMDIVVCQYDPAGNVAGQFSEQVKSCPR